MTKDSVGPHFNQNIFLEARELSKKIIKDFAETLIAGLSAEEVKSELEKIFHSKGFNKFWHPTKVRIAQDTLKTFRAENDKSLLTSDGELIFIDCGPVYENHEADYGETFRVNSKASCPLMTACSEVFNYTSTIWMAEKQSGKELYHQATDFAQSLGFELNPLMAGHRLGDFPHQLYGPGKMADIDYSPNSGLWVLEIHLVDTKSQRGAFYEDLLI